MIIISKFHSERARYFRDVDFDIETTPIKSFFLRGMNLLGKVTVLPSSPMVFSPWIAHGGGSFMYCDCWCIFDILNHKEFIEQKNQTITKLERAKPKYCLMLDYSPLNFMGVWSWIGMPCKFQGNYLDLPVSTNVHSASLSIKRSQTNKQNKNKRKILISCRN